VPIGFQRTEQAHLPEASDLDRADCKPLIAHFVVGTPDGRVADGTPIAGSAGFPLNGRRWSDDLQYEAVARVAAEPWHREEVSGGTKPHTSWTMA
jgi:hypothetical protein